MTVQTKRSKIVNLKEVLSPDDLAKLEELQTNTDGAYPVDNEWLIMAEWLSIAGYQAYLDARDDARDNDGKLLIPMEEILTLIAATRKLEAIKHYKNSEAVLIGSGSAQSKSPSNTFRTLTKEIINQAKVQNA